MLCGNGRDEGLIADCFHGYRAARTLVSFLGFVLNHAWGWYHWRKAHEYFMSPFSVFLWGVGLVADLLYPFLLWEARKTERILPNGRKVGEDSLIEKKKRGRTLSPI